MKTVYVLLHQAPYSDCVEFCAVFSGLDPLLAYVVANSGGSQTDVWSEYAGKPLEYFYREEPVREIYP